MGPPAPQNSGETGGTKPPEGRRFQQPGQSGNPGGRPKGLAASTRRVLDDAARKAAEERGIEASDGSELLARFWASIMADPAQKTQDRLTASQKLAERGWGKPPEFIPIDEGDPLAWGERELADAARDFDAEVVRLASRRDARFHQSSYSSWRRIQNSGTSPSFRPFGARSSSG